MGVCLQNAASWDIYNDIAGSYVSRFKYILLAVSRIPLVCS